MPDQQNLTDLLQDAKRIVQAHYHDLDEAKIDTVQEVLGRRMSKDALWRGVHPFNTQTGPTGVAEIFWKPVLRSFSHLQRREDIFFAGQNGTADRSQIWTASMGHLLGLFDTPFLGIPPTGKISMLRYAEFNRVRDGQIVETAFFCDLLHFMAQAGIRRFPDQRAAHLVQPGPKGHDGLLLDPQDPAEGRKTLHIIDRMIDSIDAANADPRAKTPKEELQENWHDDMIWWGPEGIGATFTIDRYIEQHQGPFRQGMESRVFNGHLCRIAEGAFGGFFGWPNLTLTNTHGFLGVPPNDIRADMRVVDIYHRKGDKLAENWIFIDILHFLKMQGVDVLAELGTD
ncbi:MAG: SnoaL-like domain-containing protein [Sulfitobacter sp.]|nr:SnoaL-like domain-containing protein [Sulfitobacter sp.]